MQFLFRVGRMLFAIGMVWLMSSSVKAEEVQLEKVGGVYELPVQINGVLQLSFILDTGAAEVFIPAEVVLTLIHSKTVSQEDFLPGKTYALADGSTLKSPRLMIRSLKIGDHVLYNIEASVSQAGSPLLLGQSLLEKIGTWTFDSQRRMLVLNSTPGTNPLATINDLEDTPISRLNLTTPTAAIQTFYDSISNEKFDVSWASLSTYSQNEFIKKVAKAAEIDPSKIKDLFEQSHSALEKSFWKSFREASNIPSFAPNASYRLVEEKDGIAIVELNSGKVTLKSIAYREGNEWRMGYVETFFK